MSTSLENVNYTEVSEEGREESFPCRRQGKVQFLVPVYNEGEGIVRLYNSLLEEGVEFDSMLVVYDMLGDTTVPFIEKLAKKDSRVSASQNEIGRGVINALRWGFSKAENGPLIVLMGDGSDKLSVIRYMVELWRQGATVVSPSRYMRGGKQHGGGMIKATLSRIAGVSLNIIGLPTCDPTNNFKLYDGKWISEIEVESVGGFEVALELCFKAYRDGLIIEQLPTEWYERREGESNFKLFEWLPHYLKWYFRVVRVLLKDNF